MLHSKLQFCIFKILHSKFQFCYFKMLHSKIKFYTVVSKYCIRNSNSVISKCCIQNSNFVVPNHCIENSLFSASCSFRSRLPLESALFSITNCIGVFPISYPIKKRLRLRVVNKMLAKFQEGVRDFAKFLSISYRG